MNDKVSPKLTSEAVQAIFDDCYTRIYDDYTIAVDGRPAFNESAKPNFFNSGVLSYYQFTFDERKLEAHSQDIYALLAQLPDKLFQFRGVKIKRVRCLQSGAYWTDSLDDARILISLADALGVAKRSARREIDKDGNWSVVERVALDRHIFNKIN